MKTILFLILFAAVVYPQSNPDGESVSIHLTPFFSMLKVTNSLGFQSTSDPKLNFNAMIKIPASDQITYSLFFQREGFGYDFALDQEGILFNQKFTFTRFGMTISYYFK